MQYIKFLLYLIKHKWLVGINCLKHCLVWRAVIHDTSLFAPSLFVPYANYMFGKYGKSSAKGQELACRKFALGDDSVNLVMYLCKCREMLYNFLDAEITHNKNSSHHWEYYVSLDSNSTIAKAPMNKKDILEMVSDWKASHKDVRLWYHKQFGKKGLLNSATVEFIEKLPEFKKID